MKRRLLIAGMVCFYLVCTSAFSFGRDSDPKPSLDSRLKQSIIRDNIEYEPMVKDIAIHEAVKNGNGAVYIAVEFRHGVTKSYVKQVLGNLVRQYISVSSQETGSPGRNIGRTRFDYHVKGVLTGGEEITYDVKIDGDPTLF